VHTWDTGGGGDRLGYTEARGGIQGIQDTASAGDTRVGLRGRQDIHRGN